MRAGAVCAIECAGVQEEVIEPLGPQFCERLLRKGLHTLQVREIKRQDGNAVLSLVESEAFICGLSFDGVSGT